MLALVHESGDEELHGEAAIAHHLHANYYRDAYSLEDIGLDHIKVEALLNRLESISRRYRDDAEYRRRADALRPPNSRFDTRRRRWERIPAGANGGFPIGE